MYFDTHAHLNDHKFADDREVVIQRAVDAGVSQIVNVGFNRQTIEDTLQLVDSYDFIYAAVGWHPVDAGTVTAEDLQWIEQLALTHPKVVAIGETGLDYYWMSAPKEVQIDVFRKQLRLAQRVQKPVIIHNRDAHGDVLRILEEENAQKTGGIMHCFAGSVEMAAACLDLNFYISFGGPLTFKNAKRPKEVAATVPLDRVLIETDAPYLAPHPLRGKRNEPSYVTHVAEALAQIHGLDVQEIGRQTSANARALFRL